MCCSFCDSSIFLRILDTWWIYGVLGIFHYFDFISKQKHFHLLRVEGISIVRFESLSLILWWFSHFFRRRVEVKVNFILIFCHCSLFSKSISLLSERHSRIFHFLCHVQLLISHRIRQSASAHQYSRQSILIPCGCCPCHMTKIPLFHTTVCLELSQHVFVLNERLLLHMPCDCLLDVNAGAGSLFFYLLKRSCLSCAFGVLY